MCQGWPPAEPLFYADWERALMIHFAVEAGELQRDVPYELDLWSGEARVSLVAFTIKDMRPRFGGRLGAALFRPIASHHFLNVRTYVRQGGEPGVYFLTEWLANRLSVLLGPVAFGLPYRYGRIDYRHDGKSGLVAGCVTDPGTGARFKYHGEIDPKANFAACTASSEAEWLMERYVAFTSHGRNRRYFRVWHEPWRQTVARVELDDLSLLEKRWEWFRGARVGGANFSPGAYGVRMGWPHRVKDGPASFRNRQPRPQGNAMGDLAPGR